MIQLRSRSLFSFLIFGFFSLTSVAAGATTTANVANPAGVAHVYPTVEVIPNGARVKATFHMKDLGSPVSWSILAPVIEANGNQSFIELVQVDDKFVHSATNYHAERTYDLDYTKINAMLKQKAPNANLQIGPGTNLFVYARWMNQPHLDMYTDQIIPGAPIPTRMTGQWNHQWGGINRQGLIVLPGGSSSAPGVTSGFTRGGTTTALDVTNPVDQLTATQFPGLRLGKSTTGSRFENELKLHIDVKDIHNVAQFFNKLEKDPALVEQTFGKGWKLVANRKYVGQPMVDDYMDNDSFGAAEKGMALRYRTGSGITSLNFKPNDGKYAGGGVYERIEYDLRDFPTLENMQKFIDSTHPLNSLQLIPEQIPGSKASDFLVKRARLTDERLKFELTAPSGDQVEISVDHVKARRLDKNMTEVGPTLEFGQLEVEVNHLGAKGSANPATPSTKTSLSESQTHHGTGLDTFLKGVGSGSTVGVALPPIFHGEEDFKPNSPIKATNASNFKLAFDVFDKIRGGVFGVNWHSSGQKYAVVAAGLGLVPPERFAPSVNRMLEEKERRANLSSPDKLKCLTSLVKLSGS